jgi:hypothetical protein
MIGADELINVNDSIKTNGLNSRMDIISIGKKIKPLVKSVQIP